MTPGGPQHTHAPAESDDDAAVLRALGYTQELDRRMGALPNFCMSFSIMCVVVAGPVTFPQALTAGGGGAIVGWVVGLLFALVVAASLGQVGSAFPTAGGLYHWSSILGGRAWGWATAWVNLLGLVFGFAALNVGTYNLARALIVEPILHIDTARWGLAEQTAAFVAMTAAHSLLNHVAMRRATALTVLNGYLILAVTIGLTAVFLIFGAGIDLARLVSFVNMTGQGGVVPEPRSMLVAFLLALLYPLYATTGFDASAHVSEETLNARRAVPRGIVTSVLVTGVTGLFMTIGFVLASPDLAATVRDGPDAWFNLFNALPAPDLLKHALALGIVAASFLAGLPAMTSMSRMIFAFARDGGLPASRLWRRVSHAWRTPVPAIWLSAALSTATTLYSPGIAVLAAGSALFLYISYAMPVAAGLLLKRQDWTRAAAFRLGRLSRPFAAVTVAGIAVLVYAGLQPPYEVLLHYCLGLAVLMLGLWLGIERRRFRGPPVAIGDRPAHPPTRGLAGLGG